MLLSVTLREAQDKWQIVTETLVDILISFIYLPEWTASPDQRWLLWHGCQYSSWRIYANRGCTRLDLHWNPIDLRGCNFYSRLHGCLPWNFGWTSQESRRRNCHVRLWILGWEDLQFGHQSWHDVWSPEKPFVYHEWQKGIHAQSTELSAGKDMRRLLGGQESLLWLVFSWEQVQPQVWLCRSCSRPALLVVLQEWEMHDHY